MPYAFIPEKATDAVSGLSGVAVKVLVALATFMPGRGQNGCYPSLAAIGERAGIKRKKTVIDALKELVSAGVVTCERRRRQTNLLKWAILEVAVSAPVMVAESATRKVPKEGTQTTSSAASEDFPTSEGNEKPIPFPQGNPTPPPTPAPSTAEPVKRKTRLKPNQHPTWRLWLRVNQDAGQPTPLEEKTSLAAAKKLATQIPDTDEQEQIMRAYIGDKADTWAIEKGLTLSILVGSRLSKCRRAAARAIEEQSADDADLIRQAMESFPDPDERADFFYQRSLLGLRVPPGVDCRPMSDEKEVAI